MESSIATKLYSHQAVPAQEAAYHDEVPKADTTAVVRADLTIPVTTCCAVTCR